MKKKHLGCWWLGQRRRELPRLHLGLEPDLFVAAVAERLVFRVPAPAQANPSAACQIKRIALRIVDRKFALDAQRAVILYRNFYLGQISPPSG